MSIRLMSEVWESAAYDQTALLVLLALADQANDRGACWPAVSTLAGRARCSERHVRAIFKVLEADGWLAIEHRSGRASLYTVTPPTPEPQFRGEVSSPLNPSSGVNWGSGVNPSSATPEPQFRTPLNPSSPRTIKEPSRNRQSASNDSEEFIEWWSAYPRKVGKGAARKAYKTAVKKAGSPALLAAIRDQAPRLMAKGAEFCPHPATWLNGERWADETEAPETPARSQVYERDMRPFEGDPDDVEAWSEHRRAERERIWRERGEIA